jgi:hypothetical protein
MPFHQIQDSNYLNCNRITLLVISIKKIKLFNYDYINKYDDEYTMCK